MLLLQRRIGFQRPDYQNRGTLALFLSVPEISLLCLPITFFSLTLFIYLFILVSAGPQVPSVAVYSTEDKQSEWPDL